ncbi:MAG TPA: putative LPS assembly protein LptD [Candidatus Hydrogenedentes bacterium]|nr:putative LPS assembly protein LptD [Candidatus Hydrogenedentota bacterium]HOL77507.1 putative LPS assembly protein LptD [Candidatus Hydrogenedentota bacterium]HPO86614.1 putative LPS assembly protein LptD [Candidatus Hydrogenedentota bacterium]
MIYLRMSRVFELAALGVVLIFPSYAHAADITVPTDGVVRDIVFSQTGKIFSSIYDRGVVRCQGTSGAQDSVLIPVGRGPSSLAVHPDTNRLACVNRIDGTISIIDTVSSVVETTISCKPGIHTVIPWDKNAFLVSDSFSNVLQVVDSTQTAPTRIFAEVSGVPGVLAASERFVAVGRRVPASVVFLARDTGQQTGVIDLPETPKRIGVLPQNRFVILLSDRLLVVDATVPRVLHQKELKVNGLCTSENGILVGTDEGLIFLGDSLEELRRSSFSDAVGAVAQLGFQVAFFVPTRKEICLTAFVQTAEAVSAQPTPVSSVPEQSPELGVGVSQSPAEGAESPEPSTPSEPPSKTEEREPLESSTTDQSIVEASSPPPVQPIPTPPTQQPTEERSPAVAPEEGQKTEESTAKAEASAARVFEKGKQPNWKSLQRTPLGGKETAAPRFSRTRPGLPGADAQVPGIAEALTSGFNLSNIGGSFQQPDWRRPWRDITADAIHRVGDKEVRATGNVELQLDTLRFRGEELYYNDETGEMSARGDVVITQNDSVLTADRLYYKVPAPSEIAEELKPFPLTSEQAEFTDQEVARKRLSLGQLTADNVYISEPYRELEADHFEYDFATRAGVLENATGHVATVYFGAVRVRVLGPADAEAEEVWVTTCDHDPPHYRIRIKRAALVAGESFQGEGAQLQIGSFRTPLYWPRWGYRVGGARTLGFDFDSGRAAKLGYYVNYAHHFMVSPDVELGLRLYPTQKQGVGFGIEGLYDFTKTPASPLFLGSGEFRSMVTTKDNGYIEFYHQHELFDDTRLLLQWEQWFDRDFVKDFYYEIYRHRTEPRTFANVTYTQPDYIATATVKQTTNDFVAETERAPEVTFHLLEKPLVDRVYVSFDSIAGYNEREPAGQHAARFVNVGRATFDWDLSEAVSLTPFVELEETWYSNQFDEDKQDTRFSTLVGITGQTRFHRTFPGMAGFSGFKHVIVPSVTLSYRPDPTMGVTETPRFDAYDNVYGRTRIETKIDNIVFGRDAETNDVWQVARLTFYQGNDFHSEVRKSDDYEMEFDLRPRPWWGVQLAAETHHITKDLNLDAPFWFERLFLEAVEDIIDRPVDPETVYRYNAQYGDYDRILGYLYYDDRVYAGKFNARIGYAYTKTRDQVFNREILYGMGYKLGEKWSVAFEHRYDFERNELMRQVYEIRRNLHCWEAAVQFRERTEGWDVGFELSLVGFPSTRVKF